MAIGDKNAPVGYKERVDAPTKMMGDFGRSVRISFKFLDNVPTPILGPDYAEVKNPNNPLAHAVL